MHLYACLTPVRVELELSPLFKFLDPPLNDYQTLNHVLSYRYTGVCLHIYTVQFQVARAYVRGQSNYHIGWVQHIL